MKISIIGAGNVGTSIAFAAMIKGLADEIVLVDVNEELAKGHAIDLSHGNPYVKPVKIYGGGYPLSEGSNIVIITAGRTQKTGESRLHLIGDNAKLMKHIVQETLSFSKAPLLLIVSNPVDVLTWVAWKESGLPKYRVIGSGTTLDTARLRQNISRHCHLDPRSIHAYVIGEHGDSEIVSWSTANIGGVLLGEFCDNCVNNCQGKDVLKKIYEETKNAAYQIIKKKGSTYFGIGLAVSKILEAVINDSHSVLTVSTIHEEFEGIKEVPFSVPSVIGRNGLERVLPLNLSLEEQEGLKKSALTIRSVIDTISIGGG
ncbi:lactate dehydrogenase [Kosmotoga arenicorallina S304]|uniref:L-lactate dehydrogenase n=1 Tax=Kosmotoga arenicorallina S304 TaxID=1453497 RepID=A0A176K1V4_9BACT|nr:L-lactate dehydrogenase [Kosmotoga arenicorallina]OAA30979.1 lactate dehydrogenase [Kosmotoga arenicorallina S304]